MSDFISRISVQLSVICRGHKSTPSVSPSELVPDCTYVPAVLHGKEVDQEEPLSNCEELNQDEMSLANISQRLMVTIGIPFKAMHSCLVLNQPESAHSAHSRSGKLSTCSTVPHGICPVGHCLPSTREPTGLSRYKGCLTRQANLSSSWRLCILLWAHNITNLLSVSLACSQHPGSSPRCQYWSQLSYAH